jgi:hypothetical protein
MVAVAVPEQPKIEPKDIMEVDMDIINIAADFYGTYYSGDNIKELSEKPISLLPSTSGTGL